jgi:triphosphoribosyl-dephospho-CoA synthase
MMTTINSPITQRDQKRFSLRYLSQSVTWALEQEARLSPKPALVDSRGSGAHKDMHLALMLASANTLEPYFLRMTQTAAFESNDTKLRTQIGLIGREAEKAMLQTTQGVNTHRGAIWALGLLIVAATTHDATIESLLSRAAAIASIEDPALKTIQALSKGQQACREYQVAGAREQAQQGFPHIQQQALPTLWESRARGDAESSARLNALLAIMATLDDTCVLSRSGISGLVTMQTGAAEVLNAGGCNTFTGRQALRQLERELLVLNASAGGAADLLAATLFIDRLFVSSTSNNKYQQ